MSRTAAIAIAALMLIMRPYGLLCAQSVVNQAAVVFIKTECVNATTGVPSERKGTGFLIEKSGFILTVSHNVSCLEQEGQSDLRKRTIVVRFGSPWEEPPRTVQLVRADEQSDIALLKVQGLPREYPVLKMCSLRSPTPETPFLAVGFPEGKAYQPVDGRIGNLEAEGGRWSAASPFVGGMSGGPVVHNGLVVGLIKGGTRDVIAARIVIPIYQASNVMESETGLRLQDCSVSQQPAIPTPSAGVAPRPSPPASPGVSPTPPETKAVATVQPPSRPSLPAAAVLPAHARTPPGTTFRDCPACPDMVVVPAGEFMMGSEAEKDEQPVRKVTIARPIAVGRFEVTEENWHACLQDGGCGDYDPWGTGKPHRGLQPVTNVSFNDAKVLTAWLSKKSGKTYRLLSEAEWEYAARAGTATRFPWGRDAGAGQANCTDCGSAFNGKVAPAGSFPANPFGLYDMHGNVWEWVEDCYVNNYGRHPALSANNVYGPAPSDGTARIDDATCKTNHGSRVLRGGSENEASSKARSSARYSADPRVRNITMGFRVARNLE